MNATDAIKRQKLERIYRKSKSRTEALSAKHAPHEMPDEYYIALRRFQSSRQLLNQLGADTESLTIWHSEATDGDPHISMRCIAVRFNDHRHDYQTNINGTRESIADYFRGARINVANFPKEEFDTPRLIEFFSKDDENGQTVNIEL